MTTTPNESIVLAGFLQHGNSQTLDEQIRVLRIVEEGLITTPIRSEPRCLCWGCYQKIGYSQEPGMQALEDGKLALEESLELFKKQWVEPAEDRHLKIFHSRNIFDQLRKEATFEDLVAEIERAIKIWKDKKSSYAGSITAFFNFICQHLNGYKNLLALLPQSSIYTSLFYGVTQIIIQASINYELTCNGFAKALKQITDEISSVENNAIMEQDFRTHALACDIFAQFFVFYRDVLHWFSARSVVRAFRSLNQDLYTQLTESVTDVRRIAGLLTRHHLLLCGEIHIDMEKATHRSLLTLQQLSMLMVKQNRALLDVSMGMSNSLHSLAQSVAIMLCEDRGTKEFLKKCELLKQRYGLTWDPTELEAPTLNYRDTEFDVPRKQLHLDEHDRKAMDKKLYRRADLQLWSRGMEDHIIQENWAFVSTLAYQSPRLELSTGLKLQEWLSSPKSAFFWISTDFTANYPSPISILCGSLVEAAVDLKLPVCTFFCRWSADYPGESAAEKEHACLLDLLYSLIRQVIDLLPAQFEGQMSFDLHLESPLGQHDLGGMEMWSTCLVALKDLLSCIPQPLLIVIDGVEHLDQTSVTKLAYEALEALGEITSERTSHSRSSKEGACTWTHPLKLLLTTAGDCDMLSTLEQHMDEDCFERVIERHGNKKRRKHTNL